MTNELLCITHYTEGVSACVVRDIHFAACEKGETCQGCVPREAEHGYVCTPCWHRLEKATSEWDYEFLPTFANEARAIQPEPGGGSRHPAPSIPLTPLQLAIEAIKRYEKTRTGDLRMWVTTPTGAEDAVRFTRAVEAAVRAFPRKEGQSKIPTTRCPACGRRTLVYDPAPAEGMEATVRCLNGECGNIMDHSSFERIALIEAQCCRRCRTDEDGCSNTDCKCHIFAPIPEWERTAKGEFEPFDPTNPNHAALVTQ